MNINYQKISMVVILSFFFLLFPITASAEETIAESDTEIVILLDCSQSMGNVDQQCEIPDMINGIVSIVPKNYKVGVVAFNNEIIFSLPIGSTPKEVSQELKNISYKQYGNAGEGLKEAVSLFKNEQAKKRILMISDGEIMMKTAQQTEESAELFAQSVERAIDQGISIDVLALGQLIEEGHAVYFAAESTSAKLYELSDEEELSAFTVRYLFDELKMKERNVGTLTGNSGELSVRLPDCFMDRVKIILLGKQDNENLTVNCKAGSIEVYKGTSYTVIEICKPESEDVKIQMSADRVMEINAYLTAEYNFILAAEHEYMPETGNTSICLSVQNMDGKNLLEGHMNDNRLKIYLDDAEQVYELKNGKIFLKKNIEENTSIRLEIIPDELYGNYYGDRKVVEQIVIPLPEEEPGPQIDWFFWSVILLFVAALFILLLFSKKKKNQMPVNRKVIDESRTLHDESRMPKNDFCGKIQVYVIHNREEIDYPPESINLFARCSREVITLEWILEACNLPLNLKGAEKVVIRPGADKSLLIKNSGRVTAMKGRELLEKGHTYHLYYHEKVTFIFDQEDTEIEVHYKDLKPNER